MQRDHCSLMREVAFVVITVFAFALALSGCGGGCSRSASQRGEGGAVVEKVVRDPETEEGGRIVILYVALSDTSPEGVKRAGEEILTRYGYETRSPDKKGPISLQAGFTEDLELLEALEREGWKRAAKRFGGEEEVRRRLEEGFFAYLFFDPASNLYRLLYRSPDSPVETEMEELETFPSSGSLTETKGGTDRCPMTR